jgi:16S rRNA (adenine1518-N6/adenine1519-N6)-dimethyltransferase
MHFMLQKEVVDRMAAAPGSKAYGRLTVMLAVFADVEPLFRIGSGAFRPPPKVSSAFVRVTPHTEPRWPVHDPGRLAALVRQAFSLRRKTLRNALAGFATLEELAALGVDPRRRPETLDAGTFVRIANECQGPSAPQGRPVY